MELHEHFDAEGKKTGHTVVTRESMWDEDARGRALRLQEFEDSTVNGMPVAEAHKEQPFKVDKVVDYAARAIEALRRHDRLEAERKFGKDKIPDGHFDGWHYYAELPDPSELREDRRGDRA